MADTFDQERVQRMKQREDRNPYRKAFDIGIPTGGRQNPHVHSFPGEKACRAGGGTRAEI